MTEHKSRRTFLKQAGTVAAATGVVGLTGCAQSDCSQPAAGASGVAQFEPVKWKMVTTWPKNFPGLGRGAETIARYINEMTAGRIEVKVYGGGELVPPFEAFDAVSRGTAEMSHGASYYWKGKTEAAQFFTAVPFGLNIQEMNGWLYHGGGLELWRELYEPFGIVPFPGGNTGLQMGGWFNKEINSVDDLVGLKMRIPGMGGEILKRAGATPQAIPGAEIYTSLQSGVIDATEWVGPYNDLAFGLNEVGQYYYYPGWQEPSAALECCVNKEAYESLPEDLQRIVAIACQAGDLDMQADFTANNHKALAQLREQGLDMRPFPDDVLNRLADIAEEVVAEVADNDELSNRIYQSYMAFQESVRGYHKASEHSYGDFIHSRRK